MLIFAARQMSCYTPLSGRTWEIISYIVIVEFCYTLPLLSEDMIFLQPTTNNPTLFKDSKSICGNSGMLKMSDFPANITGNYSKSKMHVTWSTH